MNDPREVDAGLDGALRLAFGAGSARGRMSGPSPGPSGATVDPLQKARPSDVLMAGAIVGQFRIIERIGEGGMGELFLAHDEKLDRCVALKSIRARARLSTEARRRFHREAQILGKLDHPGICRIYDYVEASDCDFLVLELIEGRPLSSVLLRPVAHGAALDYALQISEALESAHAQGVIHRDLKPTNFMVTASGRVKVLDFGIARALADAGLREANVDPVQNEPKLQAGLTQMGAVMGTLDYMSPEQARGQAVTGATDMYALGLLLQEMWTGAKARPRGLEPLELLQYIEAEGRLAAEAVRADVRRFIDDLCDPLPSRRPTAHAAVERLRHILGRRRRRLRAIFAVGALVVVSLGALKYTMDLRAAHATSVNNQNRADVLLRFMATELWTEVDRLGQLEILEDVGTKLSQYFESMPAEELSDERLADYSRAQRQIGTVWRDKRVEDSDRASRAFHSSWSLAQALSERDPDNLDRLFEVGQAQFYLGELAFLRRDFGTAETWFKRYHATSLALKQAAPSNENFAMELAWSEHNLGAVFVAQGKAEDARAVFLTSVRMWREFLVRHPGDSDWLEELASSLSWLAKASLSGGHIIAARDSLTESVGAWQELVDNDPERRGSRIAWAIAGQQLAAVHALAGDARQACELLARTGAELQELCAWDPANAEWARALALNSLHMGQAQMGQSQMALAGRSLQTCAEELERLHQATLDDHDQLYQSAASDASLAEWAWINGDTPLARRHAESACARLRPAMAAASGTDRVGSLGAAWLSRALMVLALTTDDDGGERLIQEAAACLAPHVEGCRDPRFLHSMLLLATWRSDGEQVRTITARLVTSGVSISTWERMLNSILHR